MLTPGLDTTTRIITACCNAAPREYTYGGMLFGWIDPKKNSDRYDRHPDPSPRHQHAAHRRPSTGLHRRHHPRTKSISPADYAGKWVILFSHPADFTPVCTSEFMTFASMQDQFAAYNTELVGLSVDGLSSHIAWLRTIKDKITFRDMKNVEVTFPLIEDITMEIAQSTA